MKISIQSLHFTSNQQLNDFVADKTNKLATIYKKIESADVTLKLDNSEDADNKVCEIRLAVPGNDLFAKRQSSSFEVALIEVVNALESQLRKIK
ncbi:MAG: raiA [Bacteroidota bacterium]|jgi:ribosomal subunit interface protein|nr:raiA [Bacteroidota bacterium]